ncbi:hypothetical protein [Luteibacter sp. CQ10]|uniref:hypothetical protein n=1 Tax=Luteibacter sp. CQ10 TaxID=2805821 RepID=UPI0034A3D3D8
MYEEGTKKLASQVAMLLERLSRMSQSMDERQRQAMEQQERTVRALPDVLRQAANQTLSGIAEDATQCVRAGLNEPLADVAKRADEHRRIMQASTDAMAGTQRKLIRFTHKALWLVVGLLAVILPVIATGSYLGWHYAQVIAQQRIEADLLRAYNQADLRLCDTRLCARVDRSDKRYGDYLPVKPR